MYPLNPRKNIIVIGGNAAGPAAAAKAKRADPDANVLMIEAGDFISTGTCELPYIISGEIKNFEEIVFFTPESFKKEKGVNVLISHLVEKIDRSKKIIIVKNVKTGHKFEQEFDKLILCTGSNAKSVPLLPKNLSNQFVLKSVADLIAIKSYLEKNKVRDILIVGAGYISLEVADAFKKLGYSITLIEKENLPMPGVDDETRYLISELLKQNGIEFYGGSKDVKFNQDEQKFLSIKLEGRVLEYDMVLQGVGFEPNNNLALSSKLAIGNSGGIKVDQKLRTSDPNIFAAGDCIEVINRIVNKSEYLPLATIAHQSGHTAGENAAGGNVTFQPVIKNIAVKFFEKSLVSVGLNSVETKKHGFNFSSVHTVIPNLVKVMPQSEQVFGKIIFDKNTKLILGANFFGGPETVGYGDLISSFIHNKIKATELANVNFNYTPPLSPFINILSVLGRKIERELK
ncbi:MAG: FAD-dependent oxidoreductase [Ignavibacteriales bacterium]|nr:FAD-dependent oxidoreductase [Ignavibacteriales bacterium]